jgi:AraC family transcriptional regulator of adaptative response/methylated-DNA-[protein]-cysteine methyltransferase
MEASMLSPDRVQNSDQLSRDAADYEIVRRAIAFVSEHWRTQPEIEAIAAASGVSAGDLHHLFRRWAGITPKAFLQALTLDHARDGYTTSLSPTKRCRRENGSRAAPA